MLSFYDIFRYGHAVFFVVLHAFLLLGLFLEWLRDKKSLKQKTVGTKVSVIIPVHNEEKRIEGLLKTLLAQNCPAQIIFIDDRSSDNSPVMLSQFARIAAQRGFDCRIITLSENPSVNKKQFAISRGIAEADGDYFLFTDGDCSLPPNWTRAMAAKIQDGKTGAVIAPVFKKKGKGFLSIYQCYDHAVRYIYLAGAVGLGAAGGGFGNNMIVSRKALDAAGGYDSVPSSPTEDAALISKIRSGGEYRIRAALHSDVPANTSVETEAEKSWGSFINQTLRWNNGGLFSPEPLTRLNYNVLMLFISTGILAIPLLPFFPALWTLPAGVLIVMILNTIAAFAIFKTKLPKGGLIVKFGYFLSLLFMPVYLTLMTLMGYARIKPKWKE